MKFKKKWNKQNIENFKRNFPPDVGIPRSLLMVFEFQEKIAEKYRVRQLSGHFKLQDSLWELQNVPKKIADDLIPFATDADGSAYAFWRRPDLDLDSSPIVYLGMDWEMSTIVAQNIEDFLSLLCLGVESLGYSISLDENLDNSVLETEALIEFRNWVYNALSISSPLDSMEIIQRAQERYKGFKTWLLENS